MSKGSRDSHAKDLVRPALDGTVTVQRSFEHADRAEKEYYRSLTPQERLSILIELNGRQPQGDTEGVARVYRIVELTKSDS